MKTVEIQLPENSELADFDIKMNPAAKLYEQGQLSGEQAAELGRDIEKKFYISA